MYVCQGSCLPAFQYILALHNNQNCSKILASVFLVRMSSALEAISAGITTDLNAVQCNLIYKYASRQSGSFNMQRNRRHRNLKLDGCGGRFRHERCIFS